MANRGDVTPVPMCGTVSGVFTIVDKTKVTFYPTSGAISKLLHRVRTLQGAMWAGLQWVTLYNCQKMITTNRQDKLYTQLSMW